MPDEFGVSIVGLNQFRRDLKQVDAAWPKELAKANKQAAQVVADEAIRRAPAGPHQGSGSIIPIKRSIKALQAQRRAAVAMGGARSPHAGPTEFGGTLRRHASSSRTTVRQRAFLYPAISAKTEQVVLVYSALLDQIAQKAFNQ
jgi:hypothetical protein